MRRILVLITAVALAVPLAARAQGKPGFSGAWTVDQKKSDPPPQRGGGGRGGGRGVAGRGAPTGQHTARLASRRGGGHATHTCAHHGGRAGVTARSAGAGQAGFLGDVDRRSNEERPPAAAGRWRRRRRTWIRGRRAADDQADGERAHGHDG